MKITADSITDTQIKILWQESLTARDYAMAEICELALQPPCLAKPLSRSTARKVCAQVINRGKRL